VRWRALLWFLASLAGLVPLPAAWVERLYSNTAFPLLQRTLTPLSNLAPFAFFDVLLLAAVGWLGFTTVRDLAARRGGWIWAAGRVVSRALTAAATAYLIFLATWGLNYRRQPMSSRLRFEEARISRAAALDLAVETVTRVNALYRPDNREALPESRVDATLATAFSRTQKDLGAPTPFEPGRPKRTLLDGYFRRAGVAGMTDPYFLETLVASDLLTIERPMVIAHEWSHLAGVADEGEANFAGWLTCMRGSAFHQYSGWLFLYSEVVSALPPADRRQIASGLAEGPRADLEAIRNRLIRHVNPIVSMAGWRVYDTYLKANRIDEGTASYAEVIRLVLGVEFDDGWTPRRR
jgi:hypothetical protein